MVRRREKERGKENRRESMENKIEYVEKRQKIEDQIRRIERRKQGKENRKDIIIRINNNNNGLDWRVM